MWPLQLSCHAIDVCELFAKDSDRNLALRQAYRSGFIKGPRHAKAFVKEAKILIDSGFDELSDIYCQCVSAAMA